MMTAVKFHDEVENPPGLGIGFQGLAVYKSHSPPTDLSQPAGA